MIDDTPAFKTANEFSTYIEAQASLMKVSRMDAILMFCEVHFIDPSDISGKISKSLKANLEQEFRDLNYLPQRAQLDL